MNKNIFYGILIFTFVIILYFSPWILSYIAGKISCARCKAENEACFSCCDYTCWNLGSTCETDEECTLTKGSVCLNKYHARMWKRTVVESDRCSCRNNRCELKWSRLWF